MQKIDTQGTAGEDTGSPFGKRIPAPPRLVWTTHPDGPLGYLTTDPQDQRRYEHQRFGLED